MSTRINRIVLQGFKSFNKRISIPLTPGFNVICGPNGSGKSNICDSICFVLGRTSAKSLRADRLFELIFHGTETKPPAQSASVTLYLDNSKKIFPFEEKEISIQRKVNRSGVCVYKINGKTTTREKVLELLSIARIYPEGHNIILQGDVTQIIEMSPLERRAIIDEISGIAEYDEKKRKAMKDLEVVDAKLKEAEIVINERYEIFRRLEEERNTALRYQSLQKELQLLKASIAYRKFTILQENLKRIEEEIAKKVEENEELRGLIDKIEEEIRSCEAANKEIIDELMAVSKSVDLERNISEIRSKLLIKKDKIDFLKNELERLDYFIKRLEALETVPRAVKAILNLGLDGVCGRLADLIEIPPEYQTAIEVSGKQHLNDIIVTTEDVASKCIDYLKKQQIGIATFLPLNKIKPKKFDGGELLSKKGVLGLASQLIRFDRKYENIIDFVFGDTVVVEDLDIAKEIGIGKVRMVTLDGDLVESSGAITGGYLSKRPSISEQIEKYMKLKEERRKEIDVLTKEIAELEERLKSYAGVEARKSVAELENARIDIENRLKMLNERKKAAYEKRALVQSELNRLNVQKAKTEAELESAKIEVAQYGQMEYLDESISVLKQRLDQVWKELSSFGPVNFRAIEEYERFKSEFEGYRSKYEKILEEKRAVLEMIEKIEQRRREVFYDCLNEVKRHFSEVFAELAQGEASLELENPLDLESGLLIQANPFGKKMLNIDAMSGGEKSLTAIAFLLAIQKYRPAPFYVLDEIDAALDKENTKRVAEVIKKFAKEAQFIVITHNDTTVQYGDAVYGCSMVDGESKIIGLRMP